MKVAKDRKRHLEVPERKIFVNPYFCPGGNRNVDDVKKLVRMTVRSQHSQHVEEPNQYLNQESTTNTTRAEHTTTHIDAEPPNKTKSRRPFWLDIQSQQNNDDIQPTRKPRRRQRDKGR